jgi:hypothetical protein
MITRSHSLIRPAALVFTAGMMVVLPSCQGRRRTSSGRARQADQHEFAIAIAGNPGIPFSGSYRIIESDTTTLQAIDGTTPARIRVRGTVVSAQVQKRQARGELEVRIFREGSNPGLGPCVEIDGLLFRTVARSATVQPYGIVLVSSASSVPPSTIPRRHPP